jgi:hypothetical protein
VAAAGAADRFPLALVDGIRPARQASEFQHACGTRDNSVKEPGIARPPVVICRPGRSGWMGVMKDWSSGKNWSGSYPAHPWRRFHMRGISDYVSSLNTKTSLGTFIAKNRFFVLRKIEKKVRMTARGQSNFQSLDLLENRLLTCQVQVKNGRGWCQGHFRVKSPSL